MAPHSARSRKRSKISLRIVSKHCEKIQRLEQRVEQLESENAQIKATNAQIKTETVQTTEQVKTLQQSVEEGPGPSGMAKAVQGYLGSHTFTLTGSAGMDFIATSRAALSRG